MRIFLTKLGVVSAMLLGLLAASSVAGAQSKNTTADVLSRGTVRIAVIGGYPPYSVVGPSGEPEGYDIDIAKAFAEALNVKPEFIITDVPGRITTLQTGKADLTISALTDTVQRSTAIAFSDPYLIISMQFVTLADRKELNTLADIDKSEITIGVPRGSTQDTMVPTIAKAATVTRFPNVSDNLLALDSEQVDVIAQDSLYVKSLLEKSPDKYKVLEGNYSREEIALGLPAGDFDWWRVVNTFVNEFNKSGQNAAAFRQWFGHDMPALD